ncbi:MAG TPA: DUF2090 domain-containing protein [Anaerolineae bacterium]|nr:DUF2090 domain-containing protein [Anaerolineae bacterium]HIQ05024.1 DUF2090 domain-containing protein [Anaerolineae bacterium]
MAGLSIGKLRGLQSTASDDGIFTILALDHRGSLRRMLRPDAPDAVTYNEIVMWKQRIVTALASHASAVLLDPIYGAAQAIQSGALPGHVGLLVAQEKTGYQGASHVRRTELVEGWSVAKTRRMGASAVKLLVYYHPDAGELAEMQRGLVRQVAAQCVTHDIPLFLEPVSYSLQPEVGKDSPAFAAQRRRIVVETARQFTALDIDVLKAEFPVDPLWETDESVWRDACHELTEAAATPWALLSAAVDYQTFRRMVTVACQEGASGFIAGRAVWQDALREGDAGLAEAARRLDELSEIASRYSTPWQQRHPGVAALEPITQGWHQRY